MLSKKSEVILPFLRDMLYWFRKTEVMGFGEPVHSDCAVFTGKLELFGDGQRPNARGREIAHGKSTLDYKKM